MKSSTPILTYDASSFAMDSESDPCLHQTTDAEVIPPQETFYKDAAGTFDDAWEGTDGVEEVLPESPKKKRCILDSSADDDFSSSLSDANEKHVQDFFVEDEDASECKKHWERTGKKVITLLTMCYGSKGDTEFPFFDLDPYLSMKGRKKFLPTVKTMREELVRRSIAFHDVSGPRCKNWDKTRCMLEMKKSGSKLSESDREFLFKEEANFRDTIKAANKEVLKIQEQSKEQADAWYGALPWLRLYTCIVDDRVIGAYR